jgi:carbon dioxide concentrating mechanism protein CcmL
MQIAIVRGTVTSTQKEPSLVGVKFLLVQYIDAAGQLLPDYDVAADRVGAGNEEWVLVSRGSGARQTEGSEHRPVDAAVIAIIDMVTSDNQRIYSKRDQPR